ncbi:MAG: hypothetical protein P8R42_11775 [Candidatus Binatia bacterium]|nr:hypothetical protein [Candidatus Binatia bacterium]
MRRFLSRFALALLGSLLAFGFGEWVVRQQIPVDESGQRWEGHTRLPPWRMPMHDIRNRLTALDNGESLFLVDADLGWRPRPGATSRDGQVHIDSAGIRRNANPALAPEDTQRALRIVTVGDSFTFGDEVPDNETWPAQLERLLRQDGVPARVFNLGTNAYGIDQAILRLARDGAPLRPDVVILGLQPENLMRNVNVLRPFFFPDTALPLSKPRFILRDGKLRLRNQPTLTPDEILEFLENPASHPLAPYEQWLDERYEEFFWQQSALLSLLAQRLAATDSTQPGKRARQNDDERFTDRRQAEMLQLGTALLEKFDNEAQAIGARPLLVYLPRRAELEAQLAGEEVWYGDWLAQATTDLPNHPNLSNLPGLAGHPIVRPEAGMTVASDDRFAPGGHYSAQQNRRVAQAILRALQPTLRNFRDAAHPGDARPTVTPAAR